MHTAPTNPWKHINSMARAINARNRRPTCRHLQSSNTTTLLPNHDHYRASHTDAANSERRKLIPAKLAKPINQHRIAQPPKERTLKPIEQRILHAAHAMQATTAHPPSTRKMHVWRHIRQTWRPRIWMPTHLQNHTARRHHKDISNHTATIAHTDQPNKRSMRHRHGTNRTHP
jgi:hypothetical protein